MSVRSVRINDVTFRVRAEVPSWPEFWDRASVGMWEPEMFRLMDRFLTSSWRWIDVGAWIGPTALYAAAKCGVVYTFECDPVAAQELRANIGFSDAYNIVSSNFALGSFDGELDLWSNQFGNSETSIFQRDGQSSVKVRVRDAKKVFDLGDFAARDKTIVKIDIEGAEYVILPRLAEMIATSKCIWVVSFHDHDVAALPMAYRVFSDLNWYTMDLQPTTVLHGQMVFSNAKI